MAVDEDPGGPAEAVVDFSSKGYDHLEWVEWRSIFQPGMVYYIGWPMRILPWPAQGNKSDGRGTMWAYSDRVH